MFDVELKLENQPGALAKMGEVLGKNGIPIYGGGVFVHNGIGIAHFLFEDGLRTRNVLETAGIEVISVNQVLIQRLKQGTPGQLGKFTGLMAAAGVNILAQYSDHDNQLILIVDDYEKGKQISKQWMKSIASGV